MIREDAARLRRTRRDSAAAVDQWNERRMDLPTRLIRQFVAIVEGGGVVAAARSLRMSQSALSSALQRLEDDVGAPLVVRGRDFALTDAGALVHEHARRILDDLQNAEDAIARLRADSTAEVSAAVAPEGALWPSPELAVRLLQLAPGARIAVTACDSADDAAALLRAGGRDLAILPADAVPEHCRSVRIGEHRPRMIVPGAWLVEDGRPARGRPGPLPLIVAKGGDGARTIDALHRLNAPPRVVIDGVALAAVIPLVAAGVGAGVVPQELLRQAERAGCAVLDRVELPRTVLVAAWRPEPPPPPLRAMLEAMQRTPA